MRTQLQAALRPAHVAQHQLLRDATSAVRSQLAAEQTKLRDAHHRSICLEMELSDTTEECKALKHENAGLKKERNLLESQLASRESLAASRGGHAEAQAAADNAMAQAAAYEAESRQLRAQLSVKVEELRSCNQQRLREACQHAATAAESRKLWKSLAQKDAALSTARAAAQQAATQCAALVSRDADVEKITADLESLCRAVEEAGVWNASPGLQECLAMLAGCRISDAAAEAPSGMAANLESSSPPSEHAAEGDDNTSASMAETEVEGNAALLDEVMPREAGQAVGAEAEQPLVKHEEADDAGVAAILVKQEKCDDVASNPAGTPQLLHHPGSAHGREDFIPLGSRGSPKQSTVLRGHAQAEHKRDSCSPDMHHGRSRERGPRDAGTSAAERRSSLHIKDRSERAKHHNRRRGRDHTRHGSSRFARWSHHSRDCRGPKRHHDFSRERGAITSDTHLLERPQQVNKLNAHAQQAGCCFPGRPGAQHADDHYAGRDAWPHQDASAEPQQFSHHQQGHDAWPQQVAPGWNVWPQQRPAAEMQQSTEQEQGHADSVAWGAWPQQIAAAEGHHSSGLQYEQAYGRSWKPWTQQGASAEAQPIQGDQEMAFEECTIDE
jgi:hypothetical protein